LSKVGETYEFNSFGIDYRFGCRRSFHTFKAAFAGTAYIAWSGWNNWNFSWSEDSGNFQVLDIDIADDTNK